MAITSAQIEDATISLTERLGAQTSFGRELVPVDTPLPRLARSDAPILLRGARRAGRERVARMLHYLSARAAFPFVTVTCGSFPDASLRRALFGPEQTVGDLVEPGGLICEAAGGTIYLDPVEELGPAAQGRLLRWLRSRGTGAPRIICGTHTDLQCLVAEGRFRSDLYYRINVIPITLLPAGSNGTGR